MEHGRTQFSADYLVAALSAVFNRRSAAVIVLLFLSLVVSNVLVVLHPRSEIVSASWQFVAGASLRLFGLFVFPAAIMRIAVGSARHPYPPDAAFWMFVFLFILTLVPPGIVGLALGEITSLRTGIAMVLAHAIFASPLGAWMTAGLVERPLAWRPEPWFRHLHLWLPQRLFWSVLIVAPLGLVHGQLEGVQLAGHGPWFWPQRWPTDWSRCSF